MLYASAGSLKGFAALLGGEEATASHILVKDQSTAVSLLERLRDGPQDNIEDRFAREAGKYSECPSKSKVGERERERDRACVPCVFCARFPSPRRDGDGVHPNDTLFVLFGAVTSGRANTLHRLQLVSGVLRREDGT